MIMETYQTEVIQNALAEVEKVADKIIGDRHRIVDMDRIRNKNREALRSKYLDKQIEDARNELKVHVNQLKQLTGKPELRGFDLKPVSDEEMYAIRKAAAPLL